MPLTIRSFARGALVAMTLACGAASAQTPCMSGSFWALPGSGIPPLASYLRVEGGMELQNPTAISIELWFFSYADHWGRLLTKGPGNFASLQPRPYDLYLRGDGKVQAVFQLEGGLEHRVTMTTLSPATKETWHRVLATFDSETGQARLYMDDLLHALTTIDDSGAPLMARKLLPSSDPLHIGGAPGGGSETFLGAVDEVRIWTRFFTQSQYVQSGVAPLDDVDGLAASFHFDDTLLDLTGGHVATKVGFGNFVGKCASLGHYGQGIAGTKGVPSLTLDAPPVGGSIRTLHVGNSSGALGSAILVVGLAPLDLVVERVSLLVTPSFSTWLPNPPQGLDLPFQMPAGNQVFYLQSFVPEHGAANAVAASRGLFLHTGQ